jgi:hypothetical protein
MNSYFDLNRWFLYINKHWNENKKKYLMSLGAIGGLLILWFSFLMIVNKRHPMQVDMQTAAYYVGLFITGCLFASLLFNELSDGPKGISYLLLPASLLEKLLTAILFGVVLYFACYTALFYLIDFIMVKLSNGVVSTMYEQEHLGRFTPQEVANVFVSPGEGDNFYVYFLIIYFAVQSIFMLGSVYFAKYSYIKTLVAGLVVFLVLVFFQHKIINSFMPHGGFFKPFTLYRIFDEKGELGVSLPEWFSSILIFLMKFSLPPLLWIVSYFRLKEKEV